MDPLWTHTGKVNMRRHIIWMGKRALLPLTVAVIVLIASGAYYFTALHDLSGQRGQKPFTFAVHYVTSTPYVIQVLDQFSLVVLDPLQVNPTQLEEIKAVKLVYIDLGGSPKSASLT